jgi:hypothetical protein
MKPIVVYCLGDDIFTKVICNKGSKEQDYWYFWDGDCEPIRICYDEEKIIHEMHRIHWMHKNNSKPYTDENQRVHVFFWLGTHTPKLKAKKNDRIFQAIVESFNSAGIEEYELINESVPVYYTCSGSKGQHFPQVNYSGWTPPV